MKRIKLQEVDSTNNYAKEKRSEGQSLLVTAKRQTGGRGTKGRSFVSSEGGVYLSALRFYENFPAKHAFKIMAGAAVAVCETLRFYGLEPQIKWSNDVWVGGKKICGILIENTLSGDKISSSVVGIGLNVDNVLPDELLEIATTMYAQTGKNFCVEEVTERLIEELAKERTIDEYRAYLGFMGKEATLILQDGSVAATLLCVDDEGRLIVEIEGKRQTFSSAEVSLRL